MKKTWVCRGSTAGDLADSASYHAFCHDGLDSLLINVSYT